MHVCSAGWPTQHGAPQRGAALRTRSECEAGEAQRGAAWPASLSPRATLPRSMDFIFVDNEVECVTQSCCLDLEIIFHLNLKIHLGFSVWTAWAL